MSVRWVTARSPAANPTPSIGLAPAGAVRRGHPRVDVRGVLLVGGGDAALRCADHPWRWNRSALG